MYGYHKEELLINHFKEFKGWIKNIVGKNLDLVVMCSFSFSKNHSKFNLSGTRANTN